MGGVNIMGTTPAAEDGARPTAGAPVLYWSSRRRAGRTPGVAEIMFSLSANPPWDDANPPGGSDVRRGTSVRRIWCVASCWPQYVGEKLWPPPPSIRGPPSSKSVSGPAPKVTVFSFAVLSSRSRMPSERSTWLPSRSTARRTEPVFPPSDLAFRPWVEELPFWKEVVDKVSSMTWLLYWVSRILPSGLTDVDVQECPCRVDVQCPRRDKLVYERTRTIIIQK